MSLSPRARALLDAAAVRHEPRAVDADRVLSMLAPKIGMGVAVATGGSLAAGSAAKAAGSAAAKAATVSLSTKILATVGIASAVTMGAIEYRATTPPPPPERPAAVVVAPAATSPKASPKRAGALAPAHEAAPPATEDDVAPAPTATPIAPPIMRTAHRSGAGATGAPQPVPAPAPVAAPQTKEESLADEVALLRQSEQELRRGDASSALVTLDLHARRHPAGVLTQERLAARVFVLCALGRTDEASRAADSFLSANPTSPHASRVRSSCGRNR